MLKPRRKTQDKSSDAGEFPWPRRGVKEAEKEISDDQSRDLYEKKQKDDSFTEEKRTFPPNKTTFYAKAQVFC
jgi:hypothetical protein